MYKLSNAKVRYPVLVLAKWNLSTLFLFNHLQIDIHLSFIWISQKKFDHPVFLQSKEIGPPCFSTVKTNLTTLFSLIIWNYTFIFLSFKGNFTSCFLQSKEIRPPCFSSVKRNLTTLFFNSYNKFDHPVFLQSPEIRHSYFFYAKEILQPCFSSVQRNSTTLFSFSQTKFDHPKFP